jgi:hypothetical protein
MAISTKNIHPNAPKRLVSAECKAGSERKFASELDIDHHYVSQLLHRGIEPSDQTENGRDIRVKLFLPVKKRKAREPKPEEFPGQKRIRKIIRKMHRDTTRAFHAVVKRR